MNTERDIDPWILGLAEAGDVEIPTWIDPMTDGEARDWLRRHEMDPGKHRPKLFLAFVAVSWAIAARKMWTQPPGPGSMRHLLGLGPIGEGKPASFFSLPQDQGKWDRQLVRAHVEDFERVNWRKP